MQRTLVLGRAGSGKTRYLLDRLLGYLEYGQEEGCLAVFPNRSQAEHVKRLLLSRYPDLRGFLDRSVVTFTSLAERALQGRRIKGILSGVRQDLLLRRALRRIPAPAFRRLARYAGFRRSALRLLKELKQNGLPEEELTERLDRLIATREGVTRERLASFRDLLVAYEELRAEAGVPDHEDYLRWARDRLLSKPDLLRVELLGADGFSNFTRLERELLLALAGRAELSVVTLPYDTACRPEGGRQFAVSHETLSFFEKKGFSIRELSGNPRAEAAGLAALEAGLFAPEPGRVPADGSVRVLEGADPEDEADRVARAVLGLLRDGRRPRDVLVVVRDVRSAAGRLRAAFRRHHLPLRVHGGEDLAAHPLARAGLHLVALAAGAEDRLLPLLRSGRVAGVTREDVDRREAGTTGAGERPAAGEELAAELVDLDLPRGGPELAAALRSLLDRWLRPLWRTAPQAPEGVRAERHTARLQREAGALRALRTALSEVGAALAAEGEEVEPRRFAAEFSAAIADAGYTVVDRRLMAVNLVNAREARQWEAPVVVLCGLTQGEFPRNPKEDVFLPDRDREDANRTGELAFKERCLERDEERYLFYVAVTRAREELVLTYPATDGKGVESLRSFFLEEVLRLFPAGEAPVSARSLADPLPPLGEVADRADLGRLALRGLADPHREGTDREDRALLAAALDDRFLADGDPIYRRARCEGLRFRGGLRARLSRPGALREVLGPHSASSLEDFARCPFRHFAGRVLRVAPPRRVTGLDARLCGEIAHEVLRRVFEPATRGEALADVTETLAAVLAEMHPAGARGLAEELARRELGTVLGGFVAKERDRLALASHRPAHLEWGFRDLLVPGPDGRRIRLVGRLDRIDLAADGSGVVIDYKYSSRGMEARVRKAVLAGESLQVPIYLLALEELLGVTPGGAWLYPLKEPRTSGFVIGGGPPADESHALLAGELVELLETTRERVIELDRGIRSADIRVAPRERSVCERCDFGDLCRIEPGSEGEP